MANIILKNVNKIYPNNVHAVFDFNLEIKDKEFIVFVGPSGCGKSTTLRMIAGLEEITTGEFYIDGALMNYVPPKDRNVSMVFQNYALYPHMTVYKNMAYGLTIKKDYFPIYEETEEIVSLKKEIKEAKKQISLVEKKMAKDADNAEFKNQYNELYHSILDNLNKIIEIRIPVIGLDTKRINRLNKEINALKDEIDYVSTALEKEKAEETNDQELMDMYQNDIDNITAILKQKESELESIENGDSEILKYRHYYEYEIDQKVYHTADILDLDPYLSRFPNALSGGQRQRVALGRAIVRQPKVFLMDEPLSNLDAKLRVQTRGEILALHKRVGATTIYVTHDQTEAMTLADRIVIMKDGYVQQIAKPMDAFNDPANMFVAGFIGSPAMNFVKGQFKDNKFFSDSGVVNFDLPESYCEMLKRNGKENVVLGIRPENISFAGKNTKNVVELNVFNIELLGNEMVVYTKTNGESIAMKTGEVINPSLSGSIGFAFDLNQLYFFDAETTNRIR